VLKELTKWLEKRLSSAEEEAQIRGGKVPSPLRRSTSPTEQLLCRREKRAAAELAPAIPVTSTQTSISVHSTGLTCIFTFRVGYYFGERPPSEPQA
jgi:hypothetical protein